MIDLNFVINASSPLPVDHGYHLYSTISRTLPAMHEPNGIGIHAIRGQTIGERQMRLCDWSRLTIRIAAERIAEVLPLAGKQLNIAGRTICVGVPQVHALVPAPIVRSRLVTIKLSTGNSDRAPAPPDGEAFLAAARRQLDALSISTEAQLHVGKRRTLRIHEREVVGYELIVSALTAEESLTLQNHGLGGRRHMGCGIFVPHQAAGKEIA